MPISYLPVFHGMVCFFFISLIVHALIDGSASNRGRPGRCSNRTLNHWCRQWYSPSYRSHQRGKNCGNATQLTLSVCLSVRYECCYPCFIPFFFDDGVPQTNMKISPHLFLPRRRSSFHL